MFRERVQLIYGGIRSNATYYVEFIIATILSVDAMWEIRDGSQLPQSNPFTYLSNYIAEWALIGSQILAAGLIFYGLSTVWLSRSIKARRLGNFLAFLVFTFLAILGFASDDANAIYNFIVAGMAWISAVNYLRLGTK